MSKASASIELGVCPKCNRNFGEADCFPISLDCGHTICQSCLLSLSKNKLPCPVDNKDETTPSMAHLPINVALLAAVTGHVSSALSVDAIAPNQRQGYLQCTEILVKLARLITSTKPPGRVDTSAAQTTFQKEMSSCAYLNSFGHVTLSRPMQKKLVSLISCQLATEVGRGKMGRCIRSLGERCITELILEHQDPHQLSGILWGAVRSRGCQFLGPAMQEEVIRLILMALEDGSALSRKVLVLFVVQRLHEKYPQASKTAIGHVVQLLYRASCFKVGDSREVLHSMNYSVMAGYRKQFPRLASDSNLGIFDLLKIFAVMKRENESSLMQLREQYCKYSPLRCEHDKQIIQIAHEAGLRIAPDQWSSLLYGDMSHKPTMQSIIDKLQAPQDFQQSITEFLIALGRTNDPAKLSRLREPLQQISTIPADGGTISMDICLQNLKSIELVIDSLVTFVRDHFHDQLSFGGVSHTKFKPSSRDGKPRGFPVRGQGYRNAGEDIEEHGSVMLDSDLSPGGLKPRAVVNPTTRYRPPAEHQWQNQPAGGYYHQMAPVHEMPPAERVMPPQMQNMTPQGFYSQVPAPPAMVPGMVHHSAVRVVPQSPIGPAELMQRNHGDLAMAVPHPYQSYYPSQPMGYHQYYGYVQQYQPHNPRNAPHQFEEQFIYSNHHPSAVNHTQQRPAPAPLPDSIPSHPTVHSEANPPMSLSSVELGSRPQSVASLSASSVHLTELDEADQQGLYEYWNSADENEGEMTPNLASLKRRKEELLDKIQSHLRPAEDNSGVIKTEISRDRLEDLAHSLAVSLSVGSQQDELQATFLNSMLSAANMPPLPNTPPEGAPHLSDTSVNSSWWSTNHELSAFTCGEGRVGPLYNSLSQPGLAAPRPVCTASERDKAKEEHSWTSWSGITSHCDETLSGDVGPWPALRRSLSEMNPPDADKSLSGRFSRSQSYAAGESEPIIPWSDSPYISRFGPISRGSLVSAENQVVFDTSPVTPRLDTSPTQQPPVSAELDTDLSIKVPPHVSSRNVLTLPTTTTTTPLKRPIPSPSLAHSKFTPQPDGRLGFTLANMDMEGSSSAVESEQLRQELKIVNSKIDKAEAQAVCNGLTRLERWVDTRSQT